LMLRAVALIAADKEREIRGGMKKSGLS
jgi:hypothetical protein